MADVLELPLDTVARDADFFTLGGHSLLATRLIARLRTAFGVEVRLTELFTEPTAAGLARVLESARGTALPAITPATGDGPRPLSFAQERLWFVDRLAPGSTAYNLPLTVRMKGRLDRPALAGALHWLSRRHEVLRTVFVEQGGTPYQIVQPAPAVPTPVPETDLRTLSREAAESRAATVLRKAAARPFDLAVGPLIRPALVTVAEDDHVLLLAVHHAVIDGLSMSILGRELDVVYRALAKGVEPPTGPKPKHTNYAN
jgi:acyl carrier protein